MLDLGLADDTDPAEDGGVFYARTWHIHHVQFPRCENPRVIELTSDWTQWQNEISSGWRDQIPQDHPLTVHVVQPEPPRHRRFTDAL